VIVVPFKSEKQERFMWARHPDIARRWVDEYGSVLGKMAKKHGDKRRGERRGKD
jgi:hypothetical protein